MQMPEGLLTSILVASSGMKHFLNGGIAIRPWEAAEVGYKMRRQKMSESRLPDHAPRARCILSTR